MQLQLILTLNKGNKMANSAEFISCAGWRSSRLRTFFGGTLCALALLTAGPAWADVIDETTYRAGLKDNGIPEPWRTRFVELIQSEQKGDSEA